MVTEPGNGKAQAKVSSPDSKASALSKIRSCFMYFFLDCELPRGIQSVLRSLCHYRVSEYIFSKLVSMKLHSNAGLSDPPKYIFSLHSF